MRTSSYRSSKRRGLSAGSLARGLGWFSIALGLIEVATPRRLADRIGLDGHDGLVRA
jgi:hypothetical protein